MSLQAAREGYIIVGGTLVVTACFFIYSTRKIAEEDELIVFTLNVPTFKLILAPYVM